MISRRNLLQSGMTVASGSLLGVALPTLLVGSPNNADAAESGSGLIDMHCHVFNATDLPIRGYLRQVLFKVWDEANEIPATASVPSRSGFLGGINLDTGCGEPGTRHSLIGAEDAQDSWWRGLLTMADAAARKSFALAAADYCYSHIVNQGIDALQEMAMLTGGPADSVGSVDNRSQEQVIRDGIAAYFGPQDVGGPADIGGMPTPQSPEERRRSEREQELDRQSREGRPLLLNWMRSVAGLDDGSAAPADSAGTGVVDPTELDALQRAMSRGDNYVARQLNWTLLLQASRLQLAQKISQTFSSPSSRFVLYAPALIDYSMWLDNEPHSTLSDQGQVMAQISVQMARFAERSAIAGADPSGARFHGYMAYDPLRDVKEGGRARAVVETALSSQGFLGAKLYPTMGFLPYNNSRASGLTFSRNVLARDRSNVPAGTWVQNFSATELAIELDRKLKQFFSMCQTMDAPILTHATASYGAGPDYECRAHPLFWKPVLQSFPRLRVCLGHFGDFAEARRKEPSFLSWLLSSTVDLDPGMLKNSWEWQAANLINEGCDNLYVDLSYFAEVMNGTVSDPLLTSIETALASLIKGNSRMRGCPNLPLRMLYGTDWLLLAREKNPEKHFSAVRDFLTRVFNRANNNNALQTKFWLRCVFRDNPVRFLGLRKGDGARSRLKAFYANQNPVLSSRWLEQFDDVS